MYLLCKNREREREVHGRSEEEWEERDEHIHHGLNFPHENVVSKQLALHDQETTDQYVVDYKVLTV